MIKLTDIFEDIVDQAFLKGKPVKDESVKEGADYKYLTQVILDAKPKYDVYYSSSHNVVNIGGVGYDKGDLVKNFNQKSGSSSKIKNNFYHAHQDPQKTKREVEKLSKGKIKVKIGKGGFLSYSLKESVNEGRPIPMDTPNELVYLDFKKYAEKNKKMFKKELLKHKGDGGRMFLTLSALWYKWARKNHPNFTHIKDSKKFGRALMVMMVKDNIVFSKDTWKKSGKISQLKEGLKELGITDFKSLFQKMPSDLQKRVYNLKNFGQRLDKHSEGNVLKHTIMVVNRSIKDNDIDIAIAAMFHDIGKDVTAGIHPKKGHITHFGHEKVSAMLSKKYHKWIQSVGGNTANVYYIVKNHMKFKQLDNMGIKKVMKLKAFRAFDKLSKFSKHDRGGLDEDSPTKAHPQGGRILTNKTTVMDMLDVISHKEFGPDYHKLNNSQKKKVHKIALKHKILESYLEERSKGRLRPADKLRRKRAMAGKKAAIQRKKLRTQKRKKPLAKLKKIAYKMAYLQVYKQFMEDLFPGMKKKDLSIAQAKVVHKNVLRKKGRVMKRAKFRFLPALRDKEAQKFGTKEGMDMLDQAFLKAKPIDKEIDETAKRDYKDEYKKFQSSKKSKKYRAELNKYNRDKGTYGNGDGKDASHKGGKIVGFESEKKNRGRAEKSRLKKNK